MTDPIDVNVVKVTPTIAEAWLSKNTNNRNIRRNVVAAYARDMRAGNWQLTGDAIRFDRAGTLIDGQHRLHAVITAEASVPMLVVKGLGEDVQSVIDTGAKRSPGDMLRLDGVQHPNILAAAARLAVALERVRAGLAKGISAVVVTHAEMREWIDANPDVYSAATAAQSYYRELRVPPSVLAVAVLTLARVDIDDCNEFFTSLTNHATAGPGDPRSAYLTRLTASQRQRERLNQVEHLGLIYRTWNAWRKGETLTRVAVPSALPKVR